MGSPIGYICITSIIIIIVVVTVTIAIIVVYIAIAVGIGFFVCRKGICCNPLIIEESPLLNKMFFY